MFTTHFQVRSVCPWLNSEERCKVRESSRRAGVRVCVSVSVCASLCAVRTFPRNYKNDVTFTRTRTRTDIPKDLYEIFHGSPRETEFRHGLPS